MVKMKTTGREEMKMKKRIMENWVRSWSPRLAVVEDEKFRRLKRNGGSDVVPNIKTDEKKL
jgi:hypothetical protein